MLVKSLQLGFRSGYQHTSNLLDRLFNIVLSLSLIIACLPLFVIIGLVVLIRDGRPVIYKGERLGLQKKPFTMYKFRTLVPDANQRLGRALLESRHRLFTKCGRFLRDTRLDELPQLLNILKGDMDFLGPRPERPEVYEAVCRHITDYDLRFAHRPGLIGFSQVFTPHSTPKRIRATIDNRMIARKQRMFWDIYAIALTGLVVLRSTLCRTMRYLTQTVWRQSLSKQYAEKRELTRVRQPCSVVRLTCCAHDGEPLEGRLVNINERAFLFESDRDAELPCAHLAADSPEEERFPLQCVLRADWKPGWSHPKRKTARCGGRLFHKRPLPGGGFGYIIDYNTDSPFDYYLIHQYFLKKSMTQCTRV